MVLPFLAPKTLRFCLSAAYTWAIVGNLLIAGRSLSDGITPFSRLDLGDRWKHGGSLFVIWISVAFSRLDWGDRWKLLTHALRVNTKLDFQPLTLGRSLETVESLLERPQLL